MNSANQPEPSLRAKISTLKFPITGVIIEGSQKYYTFKNRELDVLMQLIQADKEAAVHAERESNTVWHDTVLDELDYKIKEFQHIINAERPKELAQYYIDEAHKRIGTFKKWKAEQTHPQAGEGEGK